MTSSATDQPPVVVVGGSLAGMAAAARLAKAGHAVVLLEAADRLGGRAAPHLLGDGTVVDDLPATFAFPAPIRDLFRKSGRPLDAELARRRAALVPAPPVRLSFADGAELHWPTDRGEQYEVLSSTYGEGVAQRWRDLLDRLDEVWQLVRRLGLESELRGKEQLPRPVREALLHRRTVADLAAQLGHPQLRALLRSYAYRLGSDPERTPAFCATAASVERTFGRWRISTTDDRDGQTGVLTETLVERLRTRKVDVRLGQRVHGLVGDRHRISGVRTATEEIPAAAVVVTTDPWLLTDSLLPRSVAGPLRRGVHRLRPAAAPTITHRPGSPTEPGEHLDLDPDGVPVITWTRSTGLSSEHDHRRPRSDPGAGAAWRGFSDWLRRPPVSTGVAGLFAASATSPGGAGLSAELLSGALASYGVHDLIG